MPLLKDKRERLCRHIVRPAALMTKPSANLMGTHTSGAPCLRLYARLHLQNG
jgi:hypothetical protein